MKPTRMMEMLSATIPARLPVMLKGAPGIGKSDIVAQASQNAGADLIISHPVVSDPTDYKGLPFAVDGKARFLPFGELEQLINAAKRTVYFLDDLGQAPPSVQAAAMQLILARRINGHKVSDQVTFVAATNRKQDRAGVSGILEPVKSRFATIVELEPDVNDWCDWALSHGVPVELIAFIRFRPGLLMEFKPTSDISNSPCPRTVAYVGKLMQAGIPASLEYEAFSGAAGEGFAAELVGFLKIYRNLPNPDVVLMNPHQAEVPTDPATLYALTGALAQRASLQTIERLVCYANRMPDEFSVLLIRDSVKREAGIQSTRPFIDWATKHQDVLI